MFSDISDFFCLQGVRFGFDEGQDVYCDVLDASMVPFAKMIGHRGGPCIRLSNFDIFSVGSDRGKMIRDSLLEYDISS